MTAIAALTTRDFALRSFTKTRGAWRDDWCFWIFCLSHNFPNYCLRQNPCLPSHLAGVPGFEPGLSVLETDVLTVDTIPLRITWSLCDRYVYGNGDSSCWIPAGPESSSCSSS